LDSLKIIIGNYFDLYDMMIGGKVISFNEIKMTSLAHIKGYEQTLKLVRCEKLIERVINFYLV
jgi:hypothetical protein